MKISWPIGVLLGVVVCSAQNADSKHPRATEQSSFSAEDDSVKKPVAIPQDVLAALSRDKLVRDVLEKENIPAERIPAASFSASAIHLGKAGRGGPHCHVNGPGPRSKCHDVLGFPPTAAGHEFVFFGGGHDLRIKTTRSRGYRDIETLAVTMQKLSTVVYRFDGKQYKRYKEKSEEIR